MPETYVTMKQFVERAIAFENESAEFYEEMKGLVSGDETIDLMAKLAEAERDHARILSAYTASANEEPTFQFGPDLSLSMPPAPDDKNLNSMLTVAIARERKTADIYRAAAHRTSGEFRDMIEGLAGFEEEHEDRLKRLQAAYASGPPESNAPSKRTQPIYTKHARAKTEENNS